MVFNDRRIVTTRIGIFDRLFESERNYTLQTYGENCAGAGDLRAAAVRALEMAKDSAEVDFVPVKRGDAV